MRALPTALTIAGSDSSGGAGIQADLKTFAMNEVYGASVITALTAQNSIGVSDIFAPDPYFVATQLETVLEDLDVKAAKTGMLFSADIILALAPILRTVPFPLVVDPVCVAQSGATLLMADAVDLLRTEIIPLATLLTPNRHEATLLSGVEVNDRASIFEAIGRLLGMGAKAVLIKGGHFPDQVAVTDWLGMPGMDPVPLIQPRVDTHNLHGTGCTLSAAIAAHLARGAELIAAVTRAQEFLNLGLRGAFQVGDGAGPVNHMAPLLQERGKNKVLAGIAAAARRLAGRADGGRLAVDRRLNLAVAAPFARDPEHVASLSGGLVADGEGRLLALGCPEFGADKPLARMLLAMTSIHPDRSAAVLIAPNQANVKAIAASGLTLARTGSGETLDNVRAERIADTLDWPTLDRIRVFGVKPPDAVLVAEGGSPRLAVFARDPIHLAELLCRMLDHIPH